MLKIRANYIDDKGEVLILNNDNTFSVFMKKQIQPGFFRCYVRTYYDIEEAVDDYKACIDKLNNRIPARMCSANPKRRRKCCADNCPKKLGGPAYWQLFRETCLNRTK